MLIKVKTKTARFTDYQKIINKPLYKEVLKLAEKLKGTRIAHLNATSGTGGVAEILRSLVPLMTNLGLKTSWFILPPNKRFFEVTKQFHNALQGQKWNLKAIHKRVYLNYLKKISHNINSSWFDLWVVHDPQPLALVDQLNFKKAIWRCHIDTKNPDRKLWNFLFPYINQYDKVIYSLDQYAHHGIVKEKKEIICPAIDPLNDKNRPFNLSKAKKIIKQCDIDPSRPLICQVSRFDPFKDPIGVIKAYKIAKKKIPDLQLAYIGLNLTKDDPEAIRIFRQAQKAAGMDKDVHLFFDPEILVDINKTVSELVAAFQTGSDLIVQKSKVEGFGLTVTEAMWKEKVVIGGKVGGIKKQIQNGKNGYLVTSIRQCADKIVYLLANQNQARRIARQAKNSVRENYLTSRLLRDYLKIISELL